MNGTVGRREVLKVAAAVAAGTGVLSSAARGQGGSRAGRPLKACQYRMLPKGLSDAEKFALAKKCGFEGIEHSPMSDLNAAGEMGSLAREAGVPIHSISYGGWDAPLSDPRPEVTAKGIAGMENALRSAKALGAEVVLLVPGVVTESVGYTQAYERSQKNIRTGLTPAV